MKPLAYLAWFAGAAALAFSQQRTTPSAQSLPSADEAAIRAGSKIYEDAANARDWPRLLSIFTDDIVWMPPNSGAVSGRSALAAALESYPSFRDLWLEPIDLEGRGDLAFVRGRYSFVMTPANQPPQPDAGKYIEIWRRQHDGEWKYARGIFNSDLPAPAAVVAPARMGTADDALLTGTWELNVARSRFDPGPGPRAETRTYSFLPDGRQHAVYDLIEADGKRVRSESAFTLDGMDSPITGDLAEDTQAVSRTGPRTVAAVIKKNGQVTRTATREVSADGRTLTLHFKGVNAKGQSIDETWVFDRKDATADSWLALRFTTVKADKVTEFERLQREELIPALKKAGITARGASQYAMFGEGYVYAFGTPFRKFAELDEGEPILRGLGEKEGQALIEKLRACHITTRVIALRNLDDLSWGRDLSLPMFAITRIELAPGRKGEWLKFIREHYAPALRAAEVKQFAVQETVLGGSGDEVYLLGGIERYADIDTSNPRRKLGDAAHAELMSRLPAGVVLRAERFIARVRPELSIVPETKPKPTE